MTTYPYQAWILQPSFKPVEVTFEKKYSSYGNIDYGDTTSSGKLVARSEIYDTKEAAISAGLERLAKQQADLDKKQAAILKKHIVLSKATTWQH